MMKLLIVPAFFVLLLLSPSASGHLNAGKAKPNLRREYSFAPMPDRIKPYTLVYRKIAEYTVKQHGKKVIIVVLSHTTQPGQMAWAFYQLNEPVKNSMPVLTLKQFMVLDRKEMRVDTIFIEDSI